MEAVTPGGQLLATAKHGARWGQKELLSDVFRGSRHLLGSPEGSKSLNSDGFGLLAPPADCTMHKPKLTFLQMQVLFPCVVPYGSSQGCKVIANKKKHFSVLVNPTK